MPDYGNRPDGTKKGKGWLGELRTASGSVATEMSIGVEIGGKETLIPTLVPTLSKEEVSYMMNLPDNAPPGAIPDQIVEKAVRHAEDRIKQGKSPFID